MKLIHTADLHLKKGEEKRIGVLKWLVEKGAELKIDYFIIAGDLFDSDTDATILRPEIKGIFESINAQVLVIPGNHDIESFSQGYDYGKNVIQLVQTPFEIIELSSIKICGVPYQDRKFSECIEDIPSDVDILIAHGTLYDESFIFTMLDDKETEYMPIFPANLENCARYIAMGHLHSRSIEKKYQGTHVVYPGSPVALDTKCVDKRYYYEVLIDKNSLKCKPVEIEISPYWLRNETFVFPGNEQKVLDKIETFLQNIDHKHTMPNIIIKGYIEDTDKDFGKRIEQLRIKYTEIFEDMRLNTEVKSWDIIIQNRIVKNFVQKTMELDTELRMKVFSITFPIFSKVLQ